MLAHECWDWLYRQPLAKRHLSGGAVDQAVERVARRHDGVYTQLWTQLSAAQQTALTTFVRERGEELLSTRVARAYEISTPTMQTALEALRTKTVLRDEETMGTVRLRLSDPFFGAWVELITKAG